jgi:cytochrome c oxidase subunit 3
MATVTASYKASDPKNFPKKFLMWLYIVSMVMIFAGLTSAMIVSMKDNIANGSWKNFTVPNAFLVSTGVVILSSITLYWAQKGAKDNKPVAIKGGLWLTLLLGIVFLTSQYIGFTDLYASKVYFVDNYEKLGKTQVFNASGSFFMILTGMHAVHIFAGIIVLIVMLVKALMYRIDAERNLGLHLTGIFWHSLGIIWIYLYIFLTTVYN